LLDGHDHHSTLPNESEKNRSNLIQDSNWLTRQSGRPNYQGNPPEQEILASICDELLYHILWILPDKFL